MGLSTTQLVKIRICRLPFVSGYLNNASLDEVAKNDLPYFISSRCFGNGNGNKQPGPEICFVITICLEIVITFYISHQTKKIQQASCNSIVGAGTIYFFSRPLNLN